MLELLRALGEALVSFLAPLPYEPRLDGFTGASRPPPLMFDADGRPTLDRNVAVNPTAF